MRIVRVVLSLPVMQYFDYLLPTNFSVVVGSRVEVTFRKRTILGIVVKLKNYSDLPQEKLKYINKILDNQSIFSSLLWKILLWSSDYYHYSLGEILFSSLPKLLRIGHPLKMPKRGKWTITDIGRIILLKKLKNKPKQQQALSLLKIQEIHHIDLIKYNFKKRTFQALQEKQLCKFSVKTKSLSTINWHQNFCITKDNLCLNYDQKMAINTITKKQNSFNVWLIQGVTGSGKTEVYLHIIDHILASGRQVLVLVPEICLISPTIELFRNRFNVPIEIVHSGVNNDDHLTVWIKARQGEVAIIIGTRSALFTSFASLGIIVIDEEHNTSYKQQYGWLYQARDLAVVIGKQANIPIVMVSATPTLETLYNVKLGKYQHFYIRKYVNQEHLSSQTIINLKGVKVKHSLSQMLIDKISQHLQYNNQVLLFLNRRGYSSSIVCKKCGWRADCYQCNHSYTLHQYYQQLRCHYCGSKRSIPLQCSECGSPYISSVGVGTEQLEFQLRKLFPTIPLTRIDRDTITHNTPIEYYLSEALKGGPRILLGTQMIFTKVHYFSEVTLVALVDVDGTLFSADFRSTERFAQLYTQIAGRIGINTKYSEVVLQTSHPNHPVLQTLLNKGYKSFANQTLKERQIFLLPPYSHHVLMRAEYHERCKSFLFLNNVRHILNQITLIDQNFLLFGPVPALQPKLSGKYRFQLLLQHSSRFKLQQIIHSYLPLVQNLPLLKTVQWSVDVDPIDN
ncbi:MAG: primosomal protein N' [Candidatus Dasytiphilus stammeri]